MNPEGQKLYNIEPNAWYGCMSTVKIENGSFKGVGYASDGAVYRCG